MENTCLYCNTLFIYRRSTRKYCSNNCRQLDYYKRKRGFTVAGFFSVKQSGDTVKDFTVKPLSVKDSRDTVKDFTVKPLSVKTTGEQVVLSDQQLDLLAEKVVALLEDRLPQILYRKNLIVNDPPSVKDTVKTIVKKQELFTDAEKNSVKESFTVKKDEPKQLFQPVQSRFISQIVQHLDRNNSDALLKFQYPQDYWRSDYINKVKWVSLRLLCLVEYLITFSRLRYIHGEDLQELADAFTSLENSETFKSLKEDYPHKKLIRELSACINHWADKNEDEAPRFIMPPQQKAELIATRFEIGDFVPKISIDELDFEETE